MSATTKKSTTTELALEELRRREDLESLRVYLVQEQCFPSSKNPNTSPISLEELKKLVRVWKLNERRNFWKTHSERDELVSALLQHAQQLANYSTLSKKQAVNNASGPFPPSEVKPSIHLLRGSKATAKPNSPPMQKNIFGMQYFNRTIHEKELALSSRFFSFPVAEDRIENLVESWRNNDYNVKEDFNVQNDAAKAANGHGNGNNSSSVTANTMRSSVVTNIKSKVKVVKQRNLAMHLMNHSIHLDLKKTIFTAKTVQTFLNVADCDDAKTVSSCLIGLSNIAADPSVRSIIFEINAMHKVTNMLQNIRGKPAHHALALLFYYFSCDKETEDRVYNASSPVLHANGSSKDPLTRLIALYTMNNLMPCIDRQRVSELAMRTLMHYFDANVVFQDKDLTAAYLSVMQNMAWFTNAHVTLVSCGILELLQHFAVHAAHNNISDMGLIVGKTLQSFLQIPEQSSNIVTVEFIDVLCTLVKSDNEATAVQALKVATILTTVPNLRKFARDSKLSKTISVMLLQRPAITNNISKESSKFLSNITLSDGTAFDGVKFVDDRVHEATLAILKSTQAHTAAKATAIRALQNIVSYPKNAILLVTQCIEPMVKFLRDQPDQGAAQVLFNLACIPECRGELVDHKIHIKVLEFMIHSKEGFLKSAFLQILVQLSSSFVCVLELLQLDLVTKLDLQLKHISSTEVLRDISLMLLAIVAYSSKDLSHKDQGTIIHTLKAICIHGTDEDIIENCASVLKFISATFDNFDEMDPVVRAILDLGNSDEVVDCISNVLYNMTCSEANMTRMLEDSYYVNVMIRLMRNGKVHIQENIAHAMRTMCSLEKCASLLLQEDILSDLIVIALLRTNSEEIKRICSEAFYNMLCHGKTRLKFLKGDCWWALMRLGRANSQVVRAICIRALSDMAVFPAEDDDLDCRAQVLRVEALRSHHVVAFIKDLSIASSPDFLLPCLQVAHNLLGQFVNQEKKMMVASHEIVSAIRMAADAFTRAPTLKSVRIATILLLKCAQITIDGSDGEFISLDFIEVLRASRESWSEHPDCRLNISRLLFELAKNKSFAKSVPVAELSPIMMSCYSTPSLDICENIIATLLQCTLHVDVSAEDLVELEIFPLMLREALDMNSSIIPLAPVTPSSAPPNRKTMASSKDSGKMASMKAPAIEKTRSSSSYGRDIAGKLPGDHLDQVKSSAAQPSRIQGMMLSLLAHSIDHVLQVKLDLVTANLLSGVLRSEHFERSSTRSNVLSIIHSCSHFVTCAPSLLQPETFIQVGKIIQNAVRVGGSSVEGLVEFGTTLLRNLSFHSSLISTLVAIPYALNEFTKELIEAVDTTDCAMDLAVFFNHTSNSLVQSEHSLNPKFALDMIHKVTTMLVNSSHESYTKGPVLDKDICADIININKYTTSTILNKYPFTSGVDPSFVQYMLSYMQSNVITEVPEFMQQIGLKRIPDNRGVLVMEYLEMKETVAVDLLRFPAEADRWRAVRHTVCKSDETVILKFTKTLPVSFEKLETVENHNLAVFNKIVKHFDPVSLSSITATVGDGDAIAEGDEDNEEEEAEEQEENEEIGLESAPLSPQTSPTGKAGVDSPAALRSASVDNDSERPQQTEKSSDSRPSERPAEANNQDEVIEEDESVAYSETFTRQSVDERSLTSAVKEVLGASELPPITVSAKSSKSVKSVKTVATEDKDKEKGKEKEKEKKKEDKQQEASISSSSKHSAAAKSLQDDIYSMSFDD